MSTISKQPRTNVRLSMQEDFALTKWLHAHEMQPGERIDDLVLQVRKDLKIEKINYNHVQARLQEFGLKLVPADSTDPQVREMREQLEVLQHRVFALEGVVAALRSAQVQGK